MKKFSKIVIILFSLFCIAPKIESKKKLPRPSVSISITPSPSSTPNGFYSHAPFIL